MSFTRTPSGWQYSASSAPGAPGPQWSQFVSCESTTTTSPLNAEHGFRSLLGGLSGNLPPSQHPFSSAPLGSHPPFLSAPPSSMYQPQQPLSEANLTTHSGSEAGGGNVYPQSAAGGSSWRAPTAARSIASGSRPGRNAAIFRHRSYGSSAASRSIRMGQSAFSDSGSVAASSRSGSVAPSSRGGIALSSHGGSRAPSSRGGNVAPSSHAGSTASRGSRNSNSAAANQTTGQGPNWANTTIGFGPGGYAMSHSRHSWD